MKKIIRFAALILCVVLLAGCTGAADMMEQIDNIGPVTLNSLPKILSAEKSYESLSSYAKGKVENYQTLLDARSRYDAIVQEQKDLNEAISNLGTITTASRGQLNAISNRYETAKKTYYPEQFSAIGLQLEQLEKTYSRCVFDEKLADAQKLLEKGQAYDALKVLDSTSAVYHNDQYTELRDAALVKLKNNRPKNGKVLGRNLKSGINVLKVTAEEHDFVVKLYSGDDYVTFYVRSGQTATIKVPDGLYSLKYGTGEYWCDTTNYFYPSNTFSQSLTLYQFESTKRTYTQYKVTLSKTTSFGAMLNSTPISDF